MFLVTATRMRYPRWDRLNFVIGVTASHMSYPRWVD